MKQFRFKKLASFLLVIAMVFTTLTLVSTTEAQSATKAIQIKNITGTTKSIRSAKQLTFRKRNTKEQKNISMKVWERSEIKACRDLKDDFQAVRFSHPLLTK